MIEGKSFGNAAAAHLVYARGLPFRAGMDALEFRWRDGSWTRTAVEWTETLRTVLHRAGSTEDFDRVRDFVAALHPGLFESSRPHVLTASVARLLPWMLKQEQWAADVEELVDTTLAGSLPGHAGMLATTLDWAGRACDGVEVWPQPLLLLAEWLLRNGAAELRRRERAFLIRDIVVQGDRAGCEWVGLALQYGLREDAFVHFWTLEADEALWAVVERNLDSSSEYLALEPARLAGDRMHPAPRPLTGASYPRCRDAILAGLMRGDLPTATMERVWTFLFQSDVPLPPDALVTSGSALACTKNAFHGALRAPDPSRHWIDFVTSEILRVFSTPRLTSHEIGRTLMAFGGHTALAPGMLAGVQRYVRAQDLRAEPALHRLLGDDEDASVATRVSAALHLLADRPPTSIPAAPTEELERLRLDLARIVGHPWGRSPHEESFACLLGDARRVEFAELPGEDKVRIEGGSWSLDATSMADLARVAKRRGYDRGLRLAVLFAIHETIHLDQGIGDKDSVDRLRSTGAEHTLLHIDLSADHMAALLACQVFPQWDLADLKGLLGEGGFPASRWHTMAARSRKALRRISVRLDSFLRLARPDLAARLGDGYAWADFGPAGGSFLIMASGPPVALVALSPLSVADARILSGAADSGAMGAEGLAELDRCLERLVDCCTSP